MPRADRRFHLVDANRGGLELGRAGLRIGGVDGQEVRGHVVREVQGHEGQTWAQAGVVAHRDQDRTAARSLLDDFPDRGLFFRTIPSDSLQAMAMAEAVDRTGASKATIAYIDDDYGQSFADQVN